MPIYTRYNILLAHLRTHFLSLDHGHPKISLPLSLFVLGLSVIYIFCLNFQIINSLPWLPWQIPHQRFQRFDISTVPEGFPTTANLSVKIKSSG